MLGNIKVGARKTVSEYQSPPASSKPVLDPPRMGVSYVVSSLFNDHQTHILNVKL